MPDSITSTDRRLMYKVTFIPGDETFFVEAGSAPDAFIKAAREAASDGVEWTGADTETASENDLTDYWGEEE